MKFILEFLLNAIEFMCYCHFICWINAILHEDDKHLGSTFLSDMHLKDSKNIIDITCILVVFHTSFKRPAQMSVQ